MESEGSISGWIGKLRAGDEQAVRPLWERYFHRLVHLARKRLRHSPREAADEEDVALSAFDSFCRHAEKGHYPDLDDLYSLWRLLASITARKAIHLRRDATRKKRCNSPQIRPGDSSLNAGDIERIFSQEPGPELAALMAEEGSFLLHSLKDRDLQNVAVWRMQGYTVEEIARKMDVVPRSIKRKLSVIRTMWQSQVES